MNDTRAAQRRIRSGALAASMIICAGLASAQPAAAQGEAWPTKPIRLIVPFAPGGGVDAIARQIANALSASFGQQVLIDNRGGAGGLIGMDIAAKSPADGYTMLMSHTGFTAMPGLHKSLPFDPVRDFTGVATVATTPYMLVGHPSLAQRNVTELIAWMRANPGKLGYASAGTGSTIHFAGELFKRAAKVDMVHVPYKGAGPAVADVVGGQVPLMFAAMANAMPQVKAGKLRAYAISASVRSKDAPDVPTVAESGVPGFQVIGWYGLAAPAKTATATVNRLNAETVRALRTPELGDRLRGQGLEPAGDTPAEATALIRSEVARWTKLIREANIKPE